MLYSLVEMNRAAMAPMRIAVRATSAMLSSPFNPVGKTETGKNMAAMASVFERSTRYYGKPEWNLEPLKINSVPIDIFPMVSKATPWCNLIHFKKNEGALESAQKPGAAPLPRMLICAPLSGHYATLLRGTVEAFLPTHDVYITDWIDARMAPIWLGRFDLDDYIDTIRTMITHIGSGAHVLGVCQPGPPVLAAISMMAEDGDPALPASMTFMGSPIDARRSPTIPNELAETREMSWFEENMIHTVPAPYPGTLRRVYPGFVQLASFMHMNWDRHVDAQYKFFGHLVEGDGDNAQKHREFYNEYLAVLDLTEEFYLQTIQRVFQEHHLARGIYRYRDERLVDPSAIKTVALMTVEGEKDDISGIGQTQAAHDLCVNIPKKNSADYIQPGVGHYGVFNGTRFKTEIAPRVTQFTKRFTDTALDRSIAAT